MTSSRRRQGMQSAGALPEDFLTCPIRTDVRSLPREQEIRAYKLGKRRWSYNQCSLELRNPVTGVKEEVVDCMQYGATALTEKEEESAVSYQVRLKNGFRIRVHIFAVYDQPRELLLDDGRVEYEWPCITRAACPKQHCEGPVLRTIQRFGKLGRRSGQNAVEANGRNSEHNMKDAKYMFISIDEAGSHVKVKHFRLVVGMFATGDTECLASTISGPIRVLANNDVPTGAAFIKLQLYPANEWDGWSTREFQPRLPDSIQFDALPGGGGGAELSHSLSSNETDYVYSDGRRRLGRSGERQPSIRDVIVQHAHDWSNDADQGAGRLGSAITHLGYGVDSATSAPPRMMPCMGQGSPFPPFALPESIRFQNSDTDGSPVLAGFPFLPGGGLAPFGLPSPSLDSSPDLPSAMSSRSGFGMPLHAAQHPGMSMPPPMTDYNQLAAIRFPQIPGSFCNPFSQIKAPTDQESAWLEDALLTEEH